MFKKLILVLGLLLVPACNTNLIYVTKTVYITDRAQAVVNITGSEVKDTANGNTQSAKPKLSIPAVGK